LRVFLIVCAVMVSLAAGLLFAAPLLVDAARYRSDIEAVASRAAGQPVQINGALSFRILPSPRLVAENIIIAPPPRFSDLEPLLTARRADLLLSASDMLAGRIVAVSVELSEPDVTIQTNLAGHSNLVLDGSEGVLAQNVRIKQGAVRYLDERRGQEILVSDVVGTVSTDGAFDSRTAEFSGKWRGKESRLVGRLTSSERPALTVELAVSGVGEVRLQGRLQLQDGWQLDGELAFSSKDLIAAVPDLTPIGVQATPLRLKASGQASISSKEILIEGLSGDVASTAFGGRLSISKSEVLEVDASVSFEQLDGPSITPWLTVLADRAVSGQLSLPDSSPLRARLQLDAGLVSFPGGFVRQVSSTANYADGVLEVDRLAALLPGGSDFAFSGELRLSGGAFRLAGSTEFGSDNLAALLQAAGAPVRPDGHGRLRNFGLSAGILIDSSVAQVSNIDLRFDQSRVTGGVAVALVRRPSFSLNLTIDQLNANAYAGLIDGDEGAYALFQGDPAQPSMPMLGAFDTNANVRIGRLITGGSVVRGVELDAGLIGGVLNLNSLVVDDLDGGSFTLSGQIDTPDNPQWLLQGELASASPARLFGGAAGQMFPVLGRTGEVAVRFGLEGGPARTAVEMDVSGPAGQLTLTGLISRVLATPLLDLDASLSTARGRQLLLQLFPGWRIPAGISGPLQGTGQITGELDRLTLDGRIDALSARMEIAGTVKDLSGEDPGYGLDMRVRHGDLRELLQVLGADTGPTAGPPSPLDFGFRVDGNGSRTEFSNMALSAGEDGARGQATVNWTGARPRIDMSLTEGRFALDRYLSADGSGATASVLADDRSIRWSRLPLDWPWMRQVQVTVSAKLEQLDVFGLPLRQVDADVQAGPEAWSVKGMSARLAEGRIDVDAAMNMKPVPAFDVTAKLTNVPLPLVLQPLLGQAHEADGQVSAMIEAKASGLTQYDLVRSLDGQIELLSGTTVTWPPEVSLENLTGTVRIAKGVARAVRSLKSEVGTTGGEIVGSVDLGDWLAELEVRVGPAENGRRISVSGPMQDLRVR
jgi:hypothetical protein